MHTYFIHKSPNKNTKNNKHHEKKRKKSQSQQRYHHDDNDDVLLIQHIRFFTSLQFWFLLTQRNHMNDILGLRKKEMLLLIDDL